MRPALSAMFAPLPASNSSRLQLQGELKAKKDAPRLYRGVFHGMGVIAKNEGLGGLLRGLNCAVRTPIK